MRYVAYACFFFIGFMSTDYIITHARAAGAPVPHRCMPLAELKANLPASGQTLIELTHDQWAYLAGVSTLDPETPGGLPYGDKAGLLTREGAPSWAFFIDGDQACDGFKLPPEVTKWTMDIGAGNINHAGMDGPAL